MVSFDVDSLFINIPLEETITICTESIYNQNNTVESLSKSDFEKLQSVATKKSSFIFNASLHKQVCGVAMDSPLGLTLLNALFCFHEKKKKWLEQCPNY